MVVCRNRRAELQSRLQQVQQKLQDARADRRDSERDSKNAETLDSLRRLFSGIRGRLVDVCKPIQRKYNLAVTEAMGRYMEAIVVDEQKTALDCVQVSSQAHVSRACAQAVLADGACCDCLVPEGAAFGSVHFLAA
jgi:structural maintenance of chromosome 1